MLTLYKPTKEEQKILDKAKIALMTRPNSTFYNEIGFSLKYRWTEDLPTAATDGVHMYLNPAFIKSLSLEELIGLVIHEILHVAYLHPLRKGTKDHRIWNMACDYVINLVVIKSGFKLPKEGLYDTKYEGMSAEEVYAILIKEKEQNPNSPLNLQNGIPGPGEDILELPDEMSAEDVQGQIEQTLVRAAMRSQEENDAPGTIPGDIQLLIDKLLKPKLPWNRILQKYLNQFNKNDYSFKKPNRRFFPEHYLPSLYSMSLMDITVAVDISGSVSDEEFKRFVSEIASIFRMLKPKKITLIQFDTRIQHIDEIHSLQELVMVNFTGRGGTDIGEVIDWTNKNKPQLLMVFTDGEFNFRDYSTKQQVLWLIHNNPNFHPEFGKAIHYGIDR